MQALSTPVIAATPASRPKRATLRRSFWLGLAIAVVVIAITARPRSVESALGAAAIILAAVLPSGLWVYGKAKGLPLFPAFAITHAWTYGLPLLYEHPIVALFPPELQLRAALTVTGFLLLGTATWFRIARRPGKTPVRCIQLGLARADYLFLAALAGAALGNMLLSTGGLPLPGGAVSVVRAVVLAITALSAFVLSYELGKRRLSHACAVLFFILLAADIMASLSTLIMIGAMSTLAIALFGYTVGAGRFPWIGATTVIAVFAFLHIGKGDMRAKYWGESVEERTVPGPGSYPMFIAEWIRFSSAHLGGSANEEEEEGQSLLERASLMQLLLYVQTASPDEIPYLHGETYAFLPTLLVPRILMPDKPASHEGTYILNIHYGFQTREDTERTTIGFGLLNEAYANFGYLGAAALALLLALYYGAVGRWAANTPMLSLRALFAVIVASYSFQTEFAAGVLVSALFQSTVALLLIGALFMRSAPCVAQESRP